MTCIANIALNDCAHCSPQPPSRQQHHGVSAEGVERNAQFGRNVSRMRPRHNRTAFIFLIFFMRLDISRIHLSDLKNQSEAELFPRIVYFYRLRIGDVVETETC